MGQQTNKKRSNPRSKEHKLSIDLVRPTLSESAYVHRCSFGAFKATRSSLFVLLAQLSRLLVRLQEEGRNQDLPVRVQAGHGRRGRRTSDRSDQTR